MVDSPQFWSVRAAGLRSDVVLHDDRSWNSCRRLVCRLMGGDQPWISQWPVIGHKTWYLISIVTGCDGFTRHSVFASTSAICLNMHYVTVRLLYLTYCGSLNLQYFYFDNNQVVRFHILLDDKTMPFSVWNRQLYSRKYILTMPGLRCYHIPSPEQRSLRGPWQQNENLLVSHNSLLRLASYVVWMS